jgi:PD-(D/E)XK endonuclease
MVELTTDQKGAIAEAEVAAAAMKIGVGVARPLAAQRYDLILDTRTRLLRVQCKWAVLTGDVIVVWCRRCRRGRDGLIRRGYEETDIDAIAAYCPDTDRCYLLPLPMSVGRTAVLLRVAPTRNNQRRLINWAEDYEFGARLSALGPIAQLGERRAGSAKAAGSSPAGSIGFAERRVSGR